MYTEKRRRLRKYFQLILSLALDLNTIPESIISLDILRLILRRLVNPSRCSVCFPIYHNIEIAGDSLPRTSCSFRIGLEQLFFNGGWWEVCVSLQDDNLIVFCFGYDRPVPDGLNHSVVTSEEFSVWVELMHVNARLILN